MGTRKEGEDNNNDQETERESGQQGGRRSMAKEDEESWSGDQGACTELDTEKDADLLFLPASRPIAARWVTAAGRAPRRIPIASDIALMLQMSLHTHTHARGQKIAPKLHFLLFFSLPLPDTYFIYFTLTSLWTPDDAVHRLNCYFGRGFLLICWQWRRRRRRRLFVAKPCTYPCLAFSLLKRNKRTR